MPLSRKRTPQSGIQKPICIVDDDESVADSFQALLEAFGFNGIKSSRNQYYGDLDSILSQIVDDVKVACTWHVLYAARYPPGRPRTA
jgi:hypothetical protein